MVPKTGVRVFYAILGSVVSALAVSALVSMEMVPESRALYATGQFAVLVVGLLLLRRGLARSEGPAPPGAVVFHSL